MNTAILSFSKWPRCFSDQNVSVKKNRLQVPSFIGNALCKTCFTLHMCF